MSDLVNRPAPSMAIPKLSSFGVPAGDTPQSAMGPDVLPIGEHGRIFTRSEAAEALRMSEHQMYNLRRNGEIRFFKVGSAVYFTEADLADFVSRRLADSEADASRTASGSAN